MKNKTKKETWNGWVNYETQNVAVWLQNEELLYDALRMYCTSADEFPSYEGFTKNDPGHFKVAQGLLIDKLSTQTHNPDGSLSASFKNSIWSKTPDGVDWDSPKLNLEALDGMIKDMAQDDFAPVK